MKQTNTPFTLKSAALILAMSSLLVGCGGTDDDDTKSNKTPTIQDASLALNPSQAGTLQIDATDADGDTLTYSIKTAPTKGTATIDSATGLLSYTAAAEGTTLVIEVSDGTDTAEATITISINTIASFSFKDQFYKIANTHTSNSQIVHYNAETKAQTVIKTDVILGDNVFVMSGTTTGDKTTYQKREYGIFLDPSASKETRSGTDRRGRPFDYDFYFDHILKAFSADETATERTILISDNLNQDLKDDGIKVIDGGYELFINQDDIDNSYAIVKAYESLADATMGEEPDAKKHLPLTVRLSDGKHINGRILSILKNADNTTNKVLVNYVAPHKKGDYPTGDENKKRLQTCDSDLTSCADIANGNYYKLAENTTHVYLTKDGSTTISAFNKSANTLTDVTGVTYPANFDHHHHIANLSDTGGHSTGIFSNFWNLMNSKDNLSEGADAYVTINYNLDTEDKIIEGPFDQHGMFMKGHKNAMILRLSGTTGMKLYDNGTGTDLMNGSDAVPTSFHIGLIAVKNGSIALEAAQINGGANCKDEENCIAYRQAWLDTAGQTTTKSSFDNEVISEDLKYLTGFRSTPKAIGDSVYFTMREGTPVNHGGTGTIYNVWKLPMSDTSLTKADAENQTQTGAKHVLGRMLYERTAFRTTGVYDGTVILWDSNTGDIKDATNNKILGNDDLAEVGSEVVDSVIGISSSNNLAGVGGIFGLKLGSGHGAKSVLTSGESNKEDSLTVVNEISGSWITD